MSIIFPAGVHLKTWPQRWGLTILLTSLLSTVRKPTALILQTDFWGCLQARQPVWEGAHYSFLHTGRNVLINVIWITWGLQEEKSTHFLNSGIPPVGALFIVFLFLFSVVIWKIKTILLNNSLNITCKISFPKLIISHLLLKVIKGRTILKTVPCPHARSTLCFSVRLTLKGF